MITYFVSMVLVGISRSLLWAIVIGVLSIVVLVSFYHYMQPDMSIYEEVLPIEKLGGPLLVALLFPCLNALFEDSNASVWYQ